MRCSAEHRTVSALASSRAARLAGTERVTFLHRLADVGVPAINLRDEEIEAEAQGANMTTFGRASGR
jgi:predicted HTH domain antitoxin